MSITLLYEILCLFCRPGRVWRSGRGRLINSSRYYGVPVYIAPQNVMHGVHILLMCGRCGVY